MSILDRFQSLPNTILNRVRVIRIPTADIKQGANNFEDCIVYRSAGEIAVFDRICDHNGGRIISKPDGVAECPLHGWRFDAATGTYPNVGGARKKPLLRIPDQDCPEMLEIPLPMPERSLQPFTSEVPVRVRYLNHACIVVETPTLKFALDPWLIGPAFSRGWWLAHPSPADSFEELENCDFLYISHNHPDHLHPQTLSMLRRDMPLLTAKFETGSTEVFLRDLGFEDVHTVGFGTTLVDAENEIAFAALKSGDFRDDSGVLFQCGAFSACFLVDSNFCDFYRFPKGLTLLASSFAGGASGFPLCFDTKTDKEKDFILARNRAAIRSTVENVLDRAEPAHFMPYAGMFSEAAERDAYIKAHNRKNGIATYEAPCRARGIGLVNVLETPELRFSGRTLRQRDTPAGAVLTDTAADTYIAAAKDSYALQPKDLIVNYFLASGYRRDLDLYLEETDDAFRPVRGEVLRVRFRRTSDPSCTWLEGVPDLVGERAATGANQLHIRVRTESLGEVVRELLPWEDLSIGFQCRIDRVPDDYNATFWYHFTNVYVKATARRMAAECFACEVLEQRLVPDMRSEYRNAAGG